MASRTATKTARADQRARLLDAAFRLVECQGPTALRARTLSAQINCSTSVVYTNFGGMEGVHRELARAGLLHLARHLASLPDSDDPVADLLSISRAHCEWALDHPALYRLMFGITDTGRRARTTPHANLQEAATYPENGILLQITTNLVKRIVCAQRTSPAEDPVLMARRLLAAIHGQTLICITGAFGYGDDDFAVLDSLLACLMVGLGDNPDSVRGSLDKARRDTSRRRLSSRGAHQEEAAVVRRLLAENHT